jgi:hypothetical protein
MSSTRSSPETSCCARAGKSALLLGLLLLVCGCSPRELLSPVAPEDRGYMELTQSLTREGALYRGLETLLVPRAMLKTMEWRNAYASRVRDLYGLTPQEHATLLEDMGVAHERALEVVLALSAEDPLHADLMRNQIWSIFFETETLKLYPTSLERLDWPREKLRTFFPFYTRWQQYYLLTFPVPDASPGRLVIAGPGGRIDLPWNSF